MLRLSAAGPGQGRPGPGPGLGWTGPSAAIPRAGRNLAVPAAGFLNYVPLGPSRYQAALCVGGVGLPGQLIKPFVRISILFVLHSVGDGFMSGLTFSQRQASLKYAVSPQNLFHAASSCSFPGAQVRRFQHKLSMQAPDLNSDPSSRSMAYDSAGNSFEVPSERIVERPLIQFSGSQLQESLDLFESFDDQIMGGISQSTLKPGTINDASGEPNCAVFSGVVRVEGGGFVGNRMKLLAEPLDLSPFTGLYLRVRGDGKVYKLNLRTGKSGWRHLPCSER
jgi:hypothetical protein